MAPTRDQVLARLRDIRRAKDWDDLDSEKAYRQLVDDGGTVDPETGGSKHGVGHA